VIPGSARVFKSAGSYADVKLLGARVPDRPDLAFHAGIGVLRCHESINPASDPVETDTRVADALGLLPNSVEFDTVPSLNQVFVPEGLFVN
jgi:hypothetical protein